MTLDLPLPFGPTTLVKRCEREEGGDARGKNKPFIRSLPFSIQREGVAFPAHTLAGASTLLRPGSCHSPQLEVGCGESAPLRGETLRPGGRVRQLAFQRRI